MVKVIFQTNNGGGYVLGSVLEDSVGGGPLACSKTPEGWQIMTVEEV